MVGWVDSRICKSAKVLTLVARRGGLHSIFHSGDCWAGGNALRFVYALQTTLMTVVTPCMCPRYFESWIFVWCISTTFYSLKKSVYGTADMCMLLMHFSMHAYFTEKYNDLSMKWTGFCCAS